MAIRYIEQDRTFWLDTEHTSYLLAIVDQENFVGHVYYGQKLQYTENTPAPVYLLRTGEAPFVPSQNNRERVSFLDSFPMEYPGNGLGDYRESAISVRTAQGHVGVQLQYVSHEIVKEKPALPGLPSTFPGDEDCDTLILHLADPVIGLAADLIYTTFEEEDVITRSVILKNTAGQPIYVTKVMSACLDLDCTDEKYDILTLHGSWARERQMERRSLMHGKQSVGSVRGESSHQEHPFIALLSADATQDAGEVYGMHFVYSGNFLAQAELSQFDSIRMTMGIHPENFVWKLEQGESFAAPEVVMTYSAEGLGGMTRHYHDMYRNHLIRGEYRDKKRPILINNWEATYFDFDADKLYHIAEEARNIGLDMFVLDDGWFGKRDNDWCALGDWEVNEEKIKGGLPALAERIHGLGLKFGLWVEPEMISEDSDLYREYPDWALKIPGRAMNRSRHQLNLDITRKEVRDHIMNQIFKVLDACKADYVKWDMNRSVDNVFSAALPKERQGEVYHRYVLAVYEMMESLVQRYPNLLFESCSGGGGRFDAGMLYYSPQIWCSDNTDAIDRLKIQYGTSFGYPVSAMGAHVSVCPNHQSGRITPFETRGTVASSGTFGYELDLMKMSEEDKKTAREQILKYKEIEHLVQSGDYYRLINPFENNNHVLWQFVSKDKKETVVCGVRLHSEANPYIYLFYPQGLDADLHYEDIATGKVYTGAALMKAGLPLPLTTGDYQPIRFTFKAVEK